MQLELKTQTYVPSKPLSNHQNLTLSTSMEDLNSQEEGEIKAYSKTCLKWPLKKKTKNWFSRPIIT